MSNYEAILKSGNVYAVGSTMFEYDKPVMVTKDQKTYLEQNAVIKHKASGRVFSECMFEFREVTAMGKGGKKAPIAADIFTDPTAVAEAEENAVDSDKEATNGGSRRRATPGKDNE